MRKLTDILKSLHKGDWSHCLIYSAVNCNIVVKMHKHPYSENLFIASIDTGNSLTTQEIFIGSCVKNESTVIKRIKRSLTSDKRVEPRDYFIRK